MCPTTPTISSHGPAAARSGAACRTRLPIGLVEPKARSANVVLTMTVPAPLKIAGIEAASGDEGLLQFIEETDRDPRRAHLELTRILINVHQANGMVHPWERGRECDRADTGLAAEPLDERGLRSCHLLTLRGRNVERDRQDFSGPDSVGELARLRGLDFAPQAPGDADGHDGDGDINHDERARQAAQAIARPARPGPLDVRVD